MTKRAAWGVLEAVPIIGVVLFSGAFIARTSFTAGGRRYFSLFDDAMIAMRYGRNLARGDGLVWNAGGEAVEGYSNFLWTLWMAATHLVGLDASKTSLLVEVTGVALLVANLLLVRAIALRLTGGSRPAGVVALWLVALYYPLAYWTLRGMEVGLAVTLVSAATLLALRLADGWTGRDVGLLCAVAALLVLTRTDLVVPVAVVAGWLWFANRRAGVMVGLTGVGVLALHTVFRAVYYGDWLPNTYHLKMSGISLGTRLDRGLGGLVTIGQLELFAPLAIAAAFLVFRRRTAPAGAWLLGGLFAGQCAYSAYVGGDAWEAIEIANRFVAVGVPSLLVLTAVAVDRFAGGAAEERLGPLLAAAAAIVLVVVPLRVGDIRPASDLQLGKLAAEWAPVRVGTPIVVAVALVAVARWRRRPELASAGVAVVLAAAVIFGVSAREARAWVDHSAYEEADELTARVGIALHDSTAPGTLIAVAAAGGSSYFSDRPVVDLGGKSDRDIARLAPAPGARFVPGHNKYDYALSLRERADVVLPLGVTTDADRAYIRSLGYEELSPELYLHRGARTVDRLEIERLAAGLARQRQP